MDTRNNCQRFDPHMLSSLVDGSESAVSELLTLYADSCRSTVEKMVDASRKGDVRLVYEAAHRLKTSSFNVGALQLSRIAAAVEQEAEGSGDASRLQTLVDACGQEAAAALLWIVSLGRGN